MTKTNSKPSSDNSATTTDSGKIQPSSMSLTCTNSNSTTSSNAQNLHVPPEELHKGHNNLTHFTAIPWCAHILQAQNTTILHLLRRGGKTGDTFWRHTMLRPSTVHAAIHAVPSNLTSTYPRLTTSMSFYSFGGDVYSHTGICHGGFTCVLLDEAMGVLLAAIEDVEVEETKRESDDGNAEGQREGEGVYRRRAVYTTGIDVEYKRPVKAPGIVVVRCRLVGGEDGSAIGNSGGIEGKKRFVEASLEDGEGRVLVTGKGRYKVVERAGKGGWYAKL